MNRSKMKPGSHVDWFHHQLMSRLNPSKRKATTVNEMTLRTVDDDVTAVRSLANRGVDDPDSFHRAMRPIVRVAQVFGHIPVEGVGGTNADTLRFRWCSFRVIYTGYCFLIGIFQLSVHVSDLFIHQGSASFSRSSAILFCSVASVNITLCLILAKKWPSLQRDIQNLEIAMETDYGYPKKLSRNLRIVTGSILIASVAEHFISRIKEVTQAMECGAFALESLRIYFCGTYTIIFTYLVDYSVIVGVLLEHNRFVQVFSWNFMDITVIVFSIMLTSRLRQVNARLKAAKHTMMSEQFWRQVRQDYNDLSRLVKLVDQHINKITLLTFGNNLYFICLQLLLSMQKEMTSAQAVYFYSSFIHLILRSTAMCLIAASIYDESLEPKSILFSVPSESYSSEVERFITQVATDTVALTGLKFFSVTKMMLLTVVGTVVTYEIVLIQFDDSDNTKDKTVVNPFCPNITLS